MHAHTVWVYVLLLMADVFRRSFFLVIQFMVTLFTYTFRFRLVLRSHSIDKRSNEGQ
jgi:hypothetical protein